jgi:hypothetical protein
VVEIGMSLSFTGPAKEFRKTLELVDMKKMTTDDHTFFMGLQEKLDYDAGTLRLFFRKCVFAR